MKKRSPLFREYYYYLTFFQRKFYSLYRIVLDYFELGYNEIIRISSQDPKYYCIIYRQPYLTIHRGLHFAREPRFKMDEEPQNDTNDSQNHTRNIEVAIPRGTDATERLRDHDVEHDVDEDVDDDGENIGYNRSRIMSLDEEKERRASIKAILINDTLTPQERRRSIQSLMDGRRSSVGTTSSISSASNNTELYGYGDGSPDGYGEEMNYFNGNQNSSSDINTAICIPVSNEKTKRAELTRPPCNHYVRNCTLIAPCCGATFGCRICHDDSPVLPPLLIAKRASRQPARSSSMPAGWTTMDDEIHTQHDTHHTIDRFSVSEIICRVCHTKQDSKTYVQQHLLFVQFEHDRML